MGPVTVTTTVLKIIAVVSFPPCFTIIDDTDKLMENFRITKLTFLHDSCRCSSTFAYTLTWACAFFLYLINIFKMAAELYRGVLSSLPGMKPNFSSPLLYYACLLSQPSTNHSFPKPHGQVSTRLLEITFDGNLKSCDCVLTTVLPMIPYDA